MIKLKQVAIIPNNNEMPVIYHDIRSFYLGIFCLNLYFGEKQEDYHTIVRDSIDKIIVTTG